MLAGEAKPVSEAGNYLVYAGLLVCSKNRKLNCKKAHSNGTTVLQFVFLEHNPNHQLQDPAREKHKLTNYHTIIAQLFLLF